MLFRHLRLSKHRFVAAWLLLVPLAAHASDPAPAEPKPTPSFITRPDFSQYKSAKDLWENYNTATVRAANGYLDDDPIALWYKCDEMVHRFPDQRPTWRARLVAIGNLITLAKKGHPGLTAEQGAILYQALADKPGIPDDIKDRARYDVVTLRLEGTDREAAAAVRAFLRDYPNSDLLDEELADKAARRLQSSEPELAKQMADTAERLSAANEKYWADRKAAEQAKLNDPLNKPFNLKFTSLDGTEVDTAKLRGKVVLIDAWATWCGPCMQEMPGIVAAYKEYHGRGLEVVGVCLNGDEAKTGLPAFLKKHDMAWPQYYDGKGFEGEFVKRYGISMIPQLWLVNKQGVLVSNNSREHLEDDLAKLLAE